MLTNIDLPTDFVLLNRQFRSLVRSLLDEIDLRPEAVSVSPTRNGNFRQFDGSKFYLIDSGTLTLRYRHRAVCLLEEGDFLLPDVAGSADPHAAVTYGSEAGATVSAYPALQFMQQVFARPAAAKLWTRLLVTYSGMMFRIAAAQTPVDVVTTPGFEVYDSGDVIIHQGERAHFVFNLTAGIADVLVDDVLVGEVREGEIFGAMAALTNADRSATVRARTPCSVVKVPTNQFADLIKSNPATIQKLLADMAHSITHLNEQIVRLQSGEDLAD